MKAPTEKPVVRLLGEDGNAFAILGAVRKAMKRAGADKEYIEQYTNQATAGNYDHLLQVTMQYVEVE
jgi:hypothetical protein